jgi:hypothetical protein
MVFPSLTTYILYVEDDKTGSQTYIKGADKDIVWGIKLVSLLADDNISANVEASQQLMRNRE